MLIQLPPGDWVDPRHVIAVEQDFRGTVMRIEPVVIVHLTYGTKISWIAVDVPNAHYERDEIARAVNQATHPA